MAQQTFSGVPGDFSAGQVLTAADMDKLREFLLYLIKDGDETDTGEVSPLILDLNDDRVGIGQTAPYATLGIEAAASPWMHIVDTGTGTEMFGTDSTAVYVATDALPIYFKTGCTWNAHPGTSGNLRMSIAVGGTVDVNGEFTAGTKTFDIVHPTKGGDWRLRHASVEGPRHDLIYRGTVTLAGGTATVDLDEASNMTAGTWEALCRDPWTMAASSGNTVEWVLDGSTLTITSDTADAVCNWLVMAERHDDQVKSEQAPSADDDGHLVTEYERDDPDPKPPPE